jgi:hypothetical protein
MEKHTDRKVTANKPDIIIKNKKQKTCKLINVAISADRNVVQKEAKKKKEKYKSLWIEIKQMWNLKCKIIFVIIRTTRIVRKGLRKNLEVIARKHSVVAIQKTAILGIYHILWKVLQFEN